MKTVTWDNPNKMHFESPHKTFNRQCKLISTGNQVGDVVCSNFIRSYKATTVGNFIRPLGHLQNYDLTEGIVVLPLDVRGEVFLLTHKDGGVIYQFHHWGGGKRIVDGYVLTTRGGNYKLIKVWYVNQNWRARGAVDEAIKYITN